MGYDDEVPFETLQGKRLTTITGLEIGSELVTFTCADGEKFVMLHHQNCCERVAVEDIHGEVADLLLEPIARAYESSSTERPSDAPKPEYEPDSETWTFYRLVTATGATVVIRWLGESNGYYSESVSFERVSKAEESEG